MIHAQAIIEDGAIIGDNVTVGPWSFIGKNVVIGDNCVINSHVVIKGPSRIGKNNRFFQFCSIGEECQDLKYAGEPTELIIGDWKFKSVLEQTNLDADRIDMMNGMLAAMQFTINKDGSYSAVGVYGDVETGKWSLTNDYTVLKFTKTKDQISEMPIVKLAETFLTRS